MAQTYTVAMSTANPASLAQIVNAYLAEGWTLQGGVSVSSATGAGTSLFCQAMVK